MLQKLRKPKRKRLKTMVTFFRHFRVGRIVCLFFLMYSAVITLLEASSDEKIESTFVPVYAGVLADRVNIRAGCGTNFEVLGQLDKAVNVEVLGKQNGWFKIKLPEGIFGFVRKDYVDIDKVTANKLYVRAGAGLNYNSLGTLEKGQSVSIVKQEGDWLKIVPPDNCFGWVREDFLSLPSQNNILPEKKSLLAATPGVTVKPANRSEKRVIFSAIPPKPAKANDSDEKLNVSLKLDADAQISDVSANKIEVTGTIQELGKIARRCATHKLMQGKKVIYYLKSKTVDLNYFVYQKVTLSGMLEKDTAASCPIINVTQITPEQ
ncbi:MAG: SH3 domain-containing protein [Candidatus Omnitrophota bacterium]